MDGTPIYDIKPYHPLRRLPAGGNRRLHWADRDACADGEYPAGAAVPLPAEKRDALIGVLAQDPRPRYQTDASRVYGLEFGGYEVKFSVNGQKMTVTDITEKDS